MEADTLEFFVCRVALDGQHGRGRTFRDVAEVVRVGNDQRAELLALLRYIGS
jgi:hypothetical protein